jgi:hypothetical protein
MGGPAIKLDGHAVLLIQDVAVLITHGTPGECLPGAWRQSVRPLDIAQIAMLKAGMDARPVGRQRSVRSRRQRSRWRNVMASCNRAWVVSLRPSARVIQPYAASAVVAS